MSPARRLADPAPPPALCRHRLQLKSALHAQLRLPRRTLRPRPREQGAPRGEGEYPPVQKYVACGTCVSAGNGKVQEGAGGEGTGAGGVAGTHTRGGAVVSWVEGEVEGAARVLILAREKHKASEPTWFTSRYDRGHARKRRRFMRLTISHYLIDSRLEPSHRMEDQAYRAVASGLPSIMASPP